MSNKHLSSSSSSSSSITSSVQSCGLKTPASEDNVIIGIGMVFPNYQIASGTSHSTSNEVLDSVYVPYHACSVKNKDEPLQLSKLQLC